MTDGDYMFAFQSVVMPIAMEFNPDLVIVSAGFDAAAGDTIGGCMVSPAGYAHMTHMLMSLSGGKLVVCLEVIFHPQHASPKTDPLDRGATTFLQYQNRHSR